jgi:ribosomal protein S27E
VCSPRYFETVGKGSLMRTLTPGAWYLRFVCKGCKQVQILFRDLSEGETEITATYNIACDLCTHRDSYEGRDLERYYHPVENAKASTAA